MCKNADESQYEYLERLLASKEYKPKGANEPGNGIIRVDLCNLVFGKDQHIEYEKLKFLANKKFSLEKSKIYPIQVILYSDGVMEITNGHHRAAYLFGKSKTIYAQVTPANRPYPTSGSLDTIGDYLNNSYQS